MRLTLKYAVAVTGLMLSLSAPAAVAGRLEDARTAYDKGDYATALRVFRPLADQGNAIAQNNIGAIYANGHGVPKNNAEALSWYRKAADQGLAVAQNNLGGMYYFGQGVTQDFIEAMGWYRKAADQGDPNAQNTIGAMYENGQGVTQNYVEAADWYRRAADQGLDIAQHNLAVLYRDGQGIAQSDAEAFSWFRKAAEQGNAKAQHDLGAFYYRGQGVPQNYAEALNWFLKGAERGDAADEGIVGGIYAKGQGVTQNYAEAVKWFSKAAEQGNSEAQDNLASLYRRFPALRGQPQPPSRSLGAPSAASNIIKCYGDGEIVILQGAVSAQSLDMADGSVKTVWVLSVDKPICVKDSLSETRTPRQVNVSRVQIIGSPPPVGIAIELTGTLSTGNITQYYAEPTAINVASGRRIVAAASSGGNPNASPKTTAPVDAEAAKDVNFAAGLALAHEANIGVPSEMVVRSLKEAAWKPYPKVAEAVRSLVEVAHATFAASSAADFNNLKTLKNKAEGQFHDAISGVVKSCHQDEAVNETTQLGRFAAAAERQVASVRQARIEQGLPVEQVLKTDDCGLKIAIQSATPTNSRTPIEKDAVLYKNSEEDLALIDKLADLVRASNFRCESISSARPMILSKGFVLGCNRFNYTYDIQDKGGHWLVTVE